MRMKIHYSFGAKAAVSVNSLLAAVLLCAGQCFSLVVFAAAGEKVYYRYINTQGTPVINSSIPPEYAQKGYEVVTASGVLVKTVSPALSGADVARQAAQKVAEEERIEWDTQLLRRYSRAADIETAKKRKLAELEGNITILKSNQRSLKLQMVAEQARAADMERAGRAVPESWVAAISEFKNQTEIIEQQIIERRKDYDAVAAKFDDDIARFRVLRPE